MSYIKYIKTSNTKPNCMDLAIKKAGKILVIIRGFRAPDLECFFLNLTLTGFFIKYVPAVRFKKNKVVCL